jgi:peptidase YpeB-like protein
MKRILFSALVLLCCVCELATAQVTETQPMSVILHKLKVKGYLAVQQIELKQDEYVAKALDDDGQAVEIHVNAHNGDIVSMEKMNPHISITDVVENIEELGYGGITYITAENNNFVIIALGPDGKPIKLIVDAVTGRMLKFQVTNGNNATNKK